MSWQRVLGAFAEAREAKPAYQIPTNTLRLNADQRQEAIYLLLERGLLKNAGTVRSDEGHMSFYEVTPEGRLAWEIIRDSVFTRRRKEREREETLAERTVKVNPTSVFDLARVPVKWDRDKEQIRLFGYVIKGARRKPNVIWNHIDEVNRALIDPFAMFK